MSTLPPQIENAVLKVDAFMGKYPLICQDGAFWRSFRFRRYFLRALLKKLCHLEMRSQIDER